MAHGILHGNKHNLVHNLKHGGLTLQTATMTGVARDATSNIYAPASTAQWMQTMTVAGLGAGAPALCWGCQDASGNLADLIGSNAGVMTGTPTYQVAVSGWSRLGVVGADAGTAVAASTTVGNPATVSYLALGYVGITAAPAAVRQIHTVGTGTVTTDRFNLTTAALQAVSGGSLTTGPSSPGFVAVRPQVLLYDVTNNRCLAYSDQDKVVTTRAATTGAKYAINFSFTGAWLYTALFTGAQAELTDAQIKTLLTTLGWSPAWT